MAGTAAPAATRVRPKQRRSAKYDWAALRAEFITGKTSLRAFGEAKGIPWSTLKVVAADQGWSVAQMDQQERVARQVIQAAEEREFRTADEIHRNQHRISGKLIRRVEARVDEATSGTEIRALTESLESLTTQQKLSAGLPIAPIRIEVSDGPDRLEERVLATLEKLRQRKAEREVVGRRVPELPK